MQEHYHSSLVANTSRVNKKTLKSQYNQKRLRASSRKEIQPFDEDELLNELFSKPIRLPQVYKTENGTFVIEGQEPKTYKPVKMTPRQIDQMTKRMTQPKQYVEKEEEPVEIRTFSLETGTNKRKAQYIDSTINAEGQISFHEFQMILRNFGIISYSLEERPYMIEKFIELCGVVNSSEEEEATECDDEITFDVERLRQVFHDAVNGTKTSAFYREIASCITFSFRNADRSEFRRVHTVPVPETASESRSEVTETIIEDEEKGEEEDHASSLSYDADEVVEKAEPISVQELSESSVQKKKSKNNFPMFYDDIRFPEEQPSPKGKNTSSSSIARAHAASYISSNTSVSGYDKTVTRMRKNKE